MDEKKKNEALMNAAITGFAAFLGYSIIYPLMFITTPLQGWIYAIVHLFFFILKGQLIIGLGFSCVVGFISYPIFILLAKKDISAKNKKRIIYTCWAVSIVVGFLVYMPMQTLVQRETFGKEKIWQIDTNGDGKVDKWVHDNVYGKTIEVDYDTNFDGKPDVWEYYKDDKIIRKETDTDFNGKPDKTEKY